MKHKQQIKSLLIDMAVDSILTGLRAMDQTRNLKTGQLDGRTQAEFQARVAQYFKESVVDRQLELRLLIVLAEAMRQKQDSEGLSFLETSFRLSLLDHLRSFEQKIKSRSLILSLKERNNRIQDEERTELEQLRSVQKTLARFTQLGAT